MIRVRDYQTLLRDIIVSAHCDDKTADEIFLGLSPEERDILRAGFAETGKKITEAISQWNKALKDAIIEATKLITPN